MNLKPYLAVMFAASFGGFVGVLVKWLNLPTLSTTFFRLAVPTIIIFVYLKINHFKIWHGNYKIMSLASLLNAVRIFLYYFAYLHASVAYGVVILYLYPVFMALWGFIFLKEKITWQSVGMVVLAFGGTVLIYSGKLGGFSPGDLLGMGAMLLSGFIFSLTMLIYKKQTPNYTPPEIIFWQNFVGGVGSAILVCFYGLNASWAVAGSAFVYYGLVIGIFTFWLFFYGLKHLTLSQYSVLAYIEVISAVGFAVMFLGEKLTLNFGLGSVMILAAGIGLVLGKSRTVN
ncbi:MAG: hypothetical protein A2538_03220 [Candidatus Magasanikbacteria bacterium RIFOXYD2_FULL_41_14]|uniref:EamA domain-containing protein n=1 Tax=Candidatus Magasanikbacteria bacterium RIFOXYD2_FULL_41_14 TaxID=1798709 RepID=A0A1F6PCE7_9BACT|nr:MAG: hypothetical protein A2538_03220 [Candidatus Magasanikbacteria bacterium RIFOXYD2_FULL_41_14]